jgi:hypothetical protein
MVGIESGQRGFRTVTDALTETPVECPAAAGVVTGRHSGCVTTTHPPVIVTLREVLYRVKHFPFFFPRFTVAAPHLHFSQCGQGNTCTSPEHSTGGVTV